jgi:two-component system chemotaxis response regulator CheB
MSFPLPASVSESEPRIRVMIVDDAVVVRGLMSRWLGEEKDIEVVGIFRNGREAVDNVIRARPDVVILDVEMPELDGIAALPLLLARRPDLIVIMSSTLTRRNAEVSLKALSLGATDYIAKPESNREVTVSTSFRREIVERIRHLGRRRLAAPKAAPQPRLRIAPHTAYKDEDAHGRGSFQLRPFPPIAPKVIAVGSSTGGPQALQVLLRGLAPVAARIPVLVTQHMPPMFTTILAEHLSRLCDGRAREAVHGEEIKPSRIYIAPGGKHMTVERRANGASIALDDGPPVHFCKPAVDPFFASAAAAFGPGLLGVVLTGMGVDGAEGVGRIANAGGVVIAQDEATSVVWGMPGAAAHTGQCSAVLPIDDIAPKIIKLIHGDRP